MSIWGQCVNKKTNKVETMHSIVKVIKQTTPDPSTVVTNFIRVNKGSNDLVGLASLINDYSSSIRLEDLRLSMKTFSNDLNSKQINNNMLRVLAEKFSKVTDGIKEGKNKGSIDLISESADAV